LDGLDSGESNEAGGGDNRRDYFSNLSGKLQKDIEDNVRICEKLMTPFSLKKKADQKD